MREAEARTRTTLVERDGRTVRLTPAGKYLAGAANSLEEQLAYAETAAALIDNGQRPRIRIGVDFYDTVPWLTRLAVGAATPNFDVIRLPADDAIEAVRRHRVDLAVIPLATPVPADLASRLLGDDILVGVVPASGSSPKAPALTATQLAERPYLAAGFEPQRGFEFDQFFNPAGVAPGRIVRIQSLRLVLDLIANGLGVSIQPATAVPPRDDLRVRPLADHSITIQWHAVTAQTPTGDLDTFIDTDERTTGPAERRR